MLSSAEVIVSFLGSFAISASITPLFRKLAIRLSIIDKPNQRHKTHSQPIPYLGGLSIIATIFGGLTVAVIWKNNPVIDTDQIIVLLTAPFILAIVGLVDDIKNVGAFSRLLFQTMFATFTALIFARFGWFGEPTDSEFVNVAVSIFWIVGITNALNFIDNLDGGAGGIVVISSLTLSIAALLNNQFAVAATSTLLAGATLGFLVWNLHPARIYLGDSGALFLGALLSVLTIRFNPESAQPVSSWFFAFLIFAVPILDTTLVVISRIMKGLSPFMGGRDHTSHRLLTLGLSRRLTAFTIWASQVYFSFLGLLILSADHEELLLLQIFAMLSWILALAYLLNLAPMGTNYNQRR